MIEIPRLFTPLSPPVQATVDEFADKLRLLSWPERTIAFEAQWHECTDHYLKNAAFHPAGCSAASIFQGLLTLTLERLQLHSISGIDCASWLFISHHAQYHDAATRWIVLHAPEFFAWSSDHQLHDTIMAAIDAANEQEPLTTGVA